MTPPPIILPNGQSRFVRSALRLIDKGMTLSLSSWRDHATSWKSVALMQEADAAQIPARHGMRVNSLGLCHW